jgi:hypothetical protein
MAKINVGDVQRVSALNITNVAGVVTDPTTLTLKVRKPGDTAVTTYTYGEDVIVVKDSTGNFHADLPLDTEGTWRYDWVGTGAAAFSEGGRFYVFGLVTA